MPWGAAIGAAAAIGSAVISSSAASGAGSTEAGADLAAAPLVQADQAANVASINTQEQPYTALGAQSAATLQADTAPGGSLATNFSLANLQTDPGYQFDLQQGMQAVQRSAAANGTLNSGGTLKSIANYTTGLASNELNNAYTRYTTDQTNQYNRLYQLAGLGQTAVNQNDYALTNQANTDSNAQYGSTVAAGAAQAAGQIGAGNAISGGLQQLGTQGASIGNLLGGSSNDGGLSGNTATLGDLSNFGSINSETGEGLSASTANDANFLSAGNVGATEGVNF